jgi:hypothetical protein
MKRGIALLLALAFVGSAALSLSGCNSAKQVDQARVANKKAKQDK